MNPNVPSQVKIWKIVKRNRFISKLVNVKSFDDTIPEIIDFFEVKFLTYDYEYYSNDWVLNENCFESL